MIRRLVFVATLILTLFLTSTVYAAKPDKPTGLKVESKTNSSISIKWTSQGGAERYVVFFKKPSDSGYQQLSAKTNSATITNLEANTEYTIQLNAASAEGMSPPSDAISEKTTINQACIGNACATINHLKVLTDIFAQDKVSQKFNKSPGKLISNLLNVVLYVAGFLMMTWVFWGIFQYIFAGGNKEALGKARGRIIWAIVGFIFVILAFAVSQYAETFFEQKLPSGITKVTAPK